MNQEEETIKTVEEVREVLKYDARNDDEREEMWDEIATQLSKPKLERPTHRAMWEKFAIPESTYYRITAKKEFKQRIVEKCLNEAKEWMPELLAVLKAKAIEDRSEKSIEMALKYVGELADKIDHTTKGEAIKGFNYIVPNDPDIETNPETAPSVAEAPRQ